MQQRNAEVAQGHKHEGLYSNPQSLCKARHRSMCLKPQCSCREMGAREHGLAPEAYRADSLADAPVKQNLPQTKEDEAFFFFFFF